MTMLHGPTRTGDAVGRPEPMRVLCGGCQSKRGKRKRGSRVPAAVVTGGRSLHRGPLVFRVWCQACRRHYDVTVRRRPTGRPGGSDAEAS